ncbi:MAG TPA: glutathione S-transferase C-terminal domain-containing protein [Stellaceae bacterium]|nr:glutathione S-transferase C-terminal domain-containing protein [Stellaceae bacterium]
MKLYYSPGACSIGIHVLFEEIGKPYQLEQVDLRSGAQYKPPFTNINPKSKVPTVERDDGSILTEFPVIAYWLARQNPQANLLPKDDETMIRAAEAMEYVVGTMHGQGFARLFRSERFAPSAADQEAVKAAGRDIVEKGFAVIDKALAGKNYLGGNELSIADAALFYVEFWAAKRLGMNLPANCAAHFERMMARPAVQRVMKQEGFA